MRVRKDKGESVKGIEHISNLGVIATRTANFMPDRQIQWLSFYK